MTQLNRMIIFLHIPKTAGITLCSILKKQFPEELSLSLYDSRSYKPSQWIHNYPILKSGDPSTIKCVLGHFYFGLHNYIPVPATYITMLREPLERVVSLYHYIIRNPVHPLNHLVRQMSIEDYITDHRTCQETINIQTRLLSGEDVPDVNIAKENISHYFSFVGLSERFDESLFLLKKQFHWNDVSYNKLNVTEKRPGTKSYPPKVLDLIRQNNHLDYELYEYAKKLFEEQIILLDRASRKELNQFLNRSN